jgi:predicted metal-dependent peptidase
MNYKLTVKERATKLAEKWYIIDPLYFFIWTTHELSVNPSIQTMRTGNGRIEYNPDFANTLTDNELEAILKAEIMRIILKHPYARRQEHTDIMYLASNVTIKEYTDTPLDFPTAKSLFGTDEFNQKHFELYYHKIMELAQNSSGSGGANDSKSTGSGDSKGDNSGDSEGDNSSNSNGDNNSNESKGNSALDDYTQPKSGNENAALWEENDWMANTVNEKIETAIQNNSWGTIKGNMQELIKATMRPKLDYRRVLRAFRQRVLSSKRTLTRMRPSRRYEFQYMGSRRDFTTKMLFAFDVSGSISNEDLRNALSTLNQFFKYGIESIDVVQFDTEIRGKAVSIKKAQSELKVIGRGGTNFDPIMTYIDDHKDYDGLVIFTDGYAAIPAAPKNKSTKILWLFNDESSYNATYEALKHLGKAAFIK